jgi:hypothetical protein
VHRYQTIPDHGYDFTRKFSAISLPFILVSLETALLLDSKWSNTS